MAEEVAAEVAEEFICKPIHHPHPCLLMKDQKMKNLIANNDHYENLTAFLTSLPTWEPNCTSRTGKSRTLKCDCFSIFKTNDDNSPNAAACAVASFLVYWGHLKVQDQQGMTTEWIRYGSEKSACRKYLVPFHSASQYQEVGNNEGDSSLNDLQSNAVCQSALM